MENSEKSMSRSGHEPDEVCPDEIASEKALKGFIEEMVLVNIAEQNKNKGEA